MLKHFMARCYVHLCWYFLVQIDQEVTTNGTGPLYTPAFWDNYPVVEVLHAKRGRGEKNLTQKWDL